ncbi:MAG: nucleotidyltransferase domain-containing protein [Bacteroidota bacterium]
MIIRACDKDLLASLANKYFTSKVQLIAYGSRVKGDAHKASDLDLVVKSENDIDQEEFIDFKTAIQESNIPILVDVLIWDKLPESFKKNISGSYEILFTNFPEQENKITL